MILAVAMMLAVFAGCGGTAESSAVESASTPVEESVAAPAEETAEEPAAEADSVAVEAAPVTVEYPLCESGEVELEVYMAMAGFIPMVIPDVANVGFDTTRGVMLAEEATGVNLNWTLIDQDAYSEKFSIVVASGDYPDYFSTPENYVSGGIDALVDNEICIDLAPMIDTCMPDFK